MIDIVVHILDSPFRLLRKRDKAMESNKFLVQNHQLQEDLEHIYKWSDLGNIFFDEDKFVHIHYSTDQNPPVYFKPSKSHIPTKSNIKYLGVIIHNDLIFNHHILQLVAKANKIFGWALRTILSSDTPSMKSSWSKS